MKPEEVKPLFDALVIKIEETYNTHMQPLRDERIRLQTECTHNFDNSKCYLKCLSCHKMINEKNPNYKRI